MPFGRGFGFRGWFPPWPFVGLGRGGLPRCWGYTPFWGGPYAYPYGMSYPYGTGAYSSGWGMGIPYHTPMGPYGYSADDPGMFTPWGIPYEPPMTPEGEKEWLKNQAESIKQQIDQINSRMSELEKE